MVLLCQGTSQHGKVTQYRLHYFLHSNLFTLQFIHSTMYTVQYSQYMNHLCLHITLFIKQCIQYLIHSIQHIYVCILFCSSYSVYGIIFRVIATFRFPQYSNIYIVHTVQYSTIQYSQYMAPLCLHITLFIIKCIQNSSHSI